MSAAKKKNHQTTAAIIVTIIAVLATLGLSWKIGLFDIADTDASDKVVAAAIALFGSLLASLVTILGILLKHSMDVRNADLLEQEQRRLDIGTVVEALRLFSTEDGKEVSGSQRAGAFLALARLGQLDFALILLEAMWPEKRIDPHAAVWLINEGLMSTQTDLQDRAAGIMRDNASFATLENGHYCWPDSLDWKINPNLSVDAREAFLQSLVKMVLSRPKAEWDRESLVGLFVNLHVMIDDSDSAVRAGAIRATNALAAEVARHADEIATPTGFVKVDEIENDLSQAIQKIKPNEDATVVILEDVKKIENKWIKGK